MSRLRSIFQHVDLGQNPKEFRPFTLVLQRLMGQVLRVTDQAQLEQSLTLGPAGFQTASQARQQIPSSLIAIRKNVLPQPAGVIKRQMQPRLRRNIHLLSRKAASHGEDSLIVSAAGVVIHLRDPLVRGRLKVVFLPNYSVKLGQRVYPAADLSEQISLAGKEASGTGNMKFAMNGAVTIGTLDGANIEIREEVGEENFFLFGLTTPEVEKRKQEGYRPRGIYESNAMLREVLDSLMSGEFSHGDRGLFEPLVSSLLNSDEYMLLADYQSYVDCQDRVSAAYKDQDAWTRMSILNVARIGKFSSDRSIRDYSAEIWKTWPVKIQM